MPNLKAYEEILNLTNEQEELHERHVKFLQESKAKVKDIVADNKLHLVDHMRTLLGETLKDLYELKQIMTAIQTSGEQIPDNIAWLGGAQMSLMNALSQLEDAQARMGGRG